jgi:flagellar motility protein MotE (MotC chaperone)
VKRLLNVIVLALALNFLLLAGGVGWLRSSGHLDRSRANAIKLILFPATTQSSGTAANTAQPTTRPMARLEALLDREAGKSGIEQVQDIQNSVDEQSALIERSRRELDSLRTQVELAREDLESKQQAIDQRTQELSAREEEAQRLAADKGFQDSLALYQAMPAAKVKQIFLGLDDATIVNYLQAMQPRNAAKILKEFKSPDETARIQRVLEKMRTSQAGATTAPANPEAAASPADQGGEQSPAPEAANR